MTKNTLYYGDNLEIIRNYISNESVDFVYLDPPFKSNQDYNVLFREQDGSRPAAQIMAFEDTWTWDQGSEGAYLDVVENGPVKVSRAMEALRQILGENDLMAYLAMMAPRLLELHRVLKETGGICLHCDPVASHYLKVLMDAIFRPENMRNEIVWLRTSAKGLMTRRLPSNHDVILSYQKGKGATWNMGAVFNPYDADNLDEKTRKKYSHREPDGRVYRLDNLNNPNANRPNLTYEFLGMTKVWRWTRERMQAAYDAGLVVQTRPGTVPQLKRYLDEQRGKPCGDVWTDIPPLNSQAQERLGYPTQKPEALLERIIQLCTNEGDAVLDPFCGCGTSIAVAQRLNRRWAGIDITHLAITLLKHRLKDAFGEDVKKSYEVKGEPVDLSGARELAIGRDRYPFQWWALGLVGARPAEADQKKGADKGIDGHLSFHDDRLGTKSKRVILSVKSGGLKADDVRSIHSVVERDKAAIGVLIALDEPTGKMKTEAASFGFYNSPGWNTRHPKIQILTVADLLNGARIDMPPIRQTSTTFKKAPRAKVAEAPQALLPFDVEEE